MKKYLLLSFAAMLAIVLTVPATGSADPVAHGAKKCKRKAFNRKKCRRSGPAPVAPAPPAPAPTPAPLTESEVVNRVVSQAGVYCNADFYCVGYGYVTSGGSIYCSSKTTSSWTCYGYNDEDYNLNGFVDTTCVFREVVSRSGQSGITSSFDSGYGFSCS
jgi:hypothetical protein